MFWALAFLFWFSLLYGTYVLGNAVGNWIAIAALAGMLMLRRRQLRKADNGTANDPVLLLTGAWMCAHLACPWPRDKHLRQWRRGTATGRARATGVES